MSFHLKPDRPDMPRVANLRTIECCHAHEYARRDPDVVRTFRVEAARDLDCPAPGRPARATTDVGTVTGIFACDDHTRNQRVHGIAGIELRRVRKRLVLRHPPARAIAFPDLRSDIDATHC